MFNVWHNVNPERIKKDDFLAVVEISKGGRNKYELDKETGMIILDRVLYTATHYPANYGFIPRTYAEDNDPLDVLVLCQEKIDTLVLVRCYPIGVIKMIDDGAVDEKIIAVPLNDPTNSSYHDISQLPEHISREISHFFEVYKTLENKETAVLEVLGRKDAEEIIEKCIASYNEKILG
ncbi:MAG: inorganic diphosphatase [Clostridia bacterium]|nr:inorganic diphosphatase [Clostridia bacterium]